MRISDWSSDVCSSDLLRPNVKVDFEEYAPTQTADFTASAQRMFDALKDKKGRKIISIIWAGPHPLPKIADLKPERYGIEIAPGGNILPVMKLYKPYPEIGRASCRERVCQYV